MKTLVTTKHWVVRIVRITLLVAIGWWTLKGLVGAELPNPFEWRKTDFSETLVDLDEIESGGPPRDGIPPIDIPSFVSGTAADEWLEPKEPVIVVSVEKNDIEASSESVSARQVKFSQLSCLTKCSATFKPPSAPLEDF